MLSVQLAIFVFCCGFFCGTLIGILVMALARAARSDEDEEGR